MIIMKKKKYESISKKANRYQGRIYFDFWKLSFHIGKYKKHAKGI